MIRPISPKVACLAFILTTSCVYTPESGTFFDPGSSKSFAGLASVPGSTIELYAYNKSLNVWTLLTQTTSGTTPQAFNDNHTHYYWNLSYQLTNRPEYRCFMHESCTLPSEGIYEVRFQIREVAASPSILYTFDEGGLACWSARYSTGEDMYAAYWPCRAEFFDEVRLNVAIVF